MPDNIKVVGQTEDATTLRVLVTPFGGPDRKDLHGEFFHKETDFGDEIGVPVKVAMYEHSLNHLSNPYMAQDMQVIGKATFVEADELGRWYDFEIKRSHQYHDYIMKLKELGLLGASSQAYPGTKMMDPDVPGKIDRWIESEPSLTPTPAAPDTIGQIVELAKSFNLPFANPPEAGGNGAPTRKDGAAGAESDETGFVEQVEQILGDEAGNTAPDVETVTASSDEILKSLARDLTELKAGFNIFLELWGYGPDEDPRQAIQELLGLAKTVSALQKQVGDTQKGLVGFMRYMKGLKLADASVEWQRMSAAERKAHLELDAEATRQSTPKIPSPIPDSAPGRH